MARCLLATLFIPLDDPILQPLRADGHDVAAVDSISVRTENALIDALQIARALHAGQIAGAALDVFDREPLPSASPLVRRRTSSSPRTWPGSRRSPARRWPPWPSKMSHGYCAANRRSRASTPRC